ncbi:unnamed protein product [Wickerhamomyces anomalus]
MFSRLRTSSSTRIIQRACYATKAANPNNINYPLPTSEIPNAEAFLQKIGRNCIEHKEHFPNWHLLFNTTSRQMKEKGIDAQTRKYLLSQLEKYRNGEKILEIKKGKKSYFGSEYKRKETVARMHAAERKERYAKLEAEENEISGNA